MGKVLIGASGGVDSIVQNSEQTAGRYFNVNVSILWRRLIHFQFTAAS